MTLSAKRGSRMSGVATSSRPARLRAGEEGDESGADPADPGLPSQSARRTTRSLGLRPEIVTETMVAPGAGARRRRGDSRGRELLVAARTLGRPQENGHPALWSVRLVTFFARDWRSTGMNQNTSPS